MYLAELKFYLALDYFSYLTFSHTIVTNIGIIHDLGFVFSKFRNMHTVFPVPESCIDSSPTYIMMYNLCFVISTSYLVL